MLKVLENFLSKVGSVPIIALIVANKIVPTRMVLVGDNPSPDQALGSSWIWTLSLSVCLDIPGPPSSRLHWEQKVDQSSRTGLFEGTDGIPPSLVKTLPLPVSATCLMFKRPLKGSPIEVLGVLLIPMPRPVKSEPP